MEFTKIYGAQGILKPQETPKKRSVSKTSGVFGAILAEKIGSIEPVNSVQSVGGIDSILAAQQVGDEEIERTRAMKHGKDMLDEMDKLRTSIVLGRVSSDSLRRISENIKKQKNFVPDPKLQNILEDIEIRAAVELAKLGQYG
jgi:hypothetical protein